MNLNEDNPVGKSGRLSHDKNMIVRETLKNMEDQELVLSCQEKREDALKELYSRYSGMILNHLFRMVQDRVAAEDLTEETFFRVWRKAPLFDAKKGSFKTWVFRMATHLAINGLNKKLRRDKRALQVPLPEYDMEDQTESPTEAAKVSEAKTMLRRAMVKLSEKDRTVLSLRHLQGLSEQDAAQILGIPRGTVKSRSYHAIRRLKGVLKSMGF